MSPRLPAVKPRQLVRALERDGWTQIRQRGSHLHLKKPGSQFTIAVPIHNRDLKRGTLEGILKDAEISDERFLELLRG